MEAVRWYVFREPSHRITLFMVADGVTVLPGGWQCHIVFQALGSCHQLHEAMLLTVDEDCCTFLPRELLPVMLVCVCGRLLKFGAEGAWNVGGGNISSSGSVSLVSLYSHHAQVFDLKSLMLGQLSCLPSLWHSPDNGYCHHGFNWLARAGLSLTSSTFPLPLL
ncbi:hypothetical protein Salat_0952900 [Sesamum alatum]|uniref:Uncharacterized protein n=1 Tax=Sesamum alatum TaxID=300844 RepID=A0AAE1YLQ7_9LAMI|nr:hypothetical protein Salat_0952900 [Sesamum alatum]